MVGTHVHRSSSILHQHADLLDSSVSACRRRASLGELLLQGKSTCQRPDRTFRFRGDGAHAFASFYWRSGARRFRSAKTFRERVEPLLDVRTSVTSPKRRAAHSCRSRLAGEKGERARWRIGSARPSPLGHCAPLAARGQLSEQRDLLPRPRRAQMSVTVARCVATPSPWCFKNDDVAQSAAYDRAANRQIIALVGRGRHADADHRALTEVGIVDPAQRLGPSTNSGDSVGG